MLEEPKLKTLNHLVEGLSREELVWLNGYVSGLVKGAPAKEDKKTLGKITIAFGTETGNSKKLATEFASKARKRGLSVKLSALDQYRLTDLLKEENFFTVISTHGEGEPPASAKKFFDHIHEHELSLDKLQYSVLALGDTAYPLFCKAGEDVDVKLHSFGAKRISPIQKCDTNYEEEANEWFDRVMEAISIGHVSKVEKQVVSKTTHKRNFTGTILSTVNLNGKGSSKETFHLEIAAEDVVYEPGDSIGIVPENPSAMVQALINLTGIEGARKISFRDEEWIVSDLLTKRLHIFYLPERVVSKYASIVQQQIPITRMDLINLIKIYPPRNVEQFEEILQSLETITPRLYSISSSRLAHTDEVHITVVRNCFQLDNELRHGLCSDYLADLPENSTVEFYVHRNLQFRLPAQDKDIIMIGPGTGIAPFRAFIEERANTSVTGKSWLFFGDQHFTTDFLYQTELQDYFSTGVLSKINVAFSRDQKEKVYVQHKMVEHAAELLQWIASGAYLYVCGAKNPMSGDVEKTLLEIIQSTGNKTREQALDFLNQMTEEGKYLKDVY